MAKNPEKTLDPAEVKKQLESIAGREIDAPAASIINIWYASGASDYTDGTVAWHSIFFPGSRCEEVPLLDASGSLSTGSDGKRTFLLSSVICLPAQRSLAEPVNVLATPRSATPCFVTTTHTVIKSDPNTPFLDDVQMTVFAWKTNGEPAAGVEFDWRCRVVSNTIIL